MEEKYKIHAIYIVSILISIIIILITVKWGDIPKLVEYITFSLSVTSLVLGILAIAYGVYSTSAFSQSSAALITASHDISKNSIELTSTTNELAKRIEALPGLVQNVGEKVDTTKGMLKEFLEKSGPQPTTNIPGTAPSEPTLTSFLKRSSIVGLLGLYACLLSRQKNKPFNLDDLSTATTPLKYVQEVSKYWMGYIAASTACGILSSTLEKGVVTVMQLHEYMERNLQAEIENKIRNSKLDHGAKELYSEQKAKIDTYFT